MSSNLTIVQFLDAVDYWNDHRRNLRDIPSVDVYLNLIHDIGGKLPVNQQQYYLNRKTPVEVIKRSLKKRLYRRFVYLTDTAKIDSSLIIDLLMISMDNFLNNMLERLVIRQLSSTTYFLNSTLIEQTEHDKIYECKRLWYTTINRKPPIRNDALVLFNDDQVYEYNTLDTTFDFLSAYKFTPSIQITPSIACIPDDIKHSPNKESTIAI